MKEATALPVKRITDFDGEDGAVTIFQRPAFWLVFSLVMAVSGIVLPPYLVVVWRDDALWGGVAFLIATIFAAIQRERTQVALRNARYERFALYLESVSPNLLRAVAASPEYDKASKDAVTKYLSAAHPGWSLT
jgi:hypothetical protein